MRIAIRSGVAGVTVIAVGCLAAAGKLPRNMFAGIRIPSTLRSDAAWQAGHRAAAGALTVAGVGPLLAGVVVAARHPAPATAKTLGRVGNAWLLGWLGLATVQANRAARDVTREVAASEV